MHSAKWDSTYDLTGKTVAVVGGGSSAVQVIPSIQPSKFLSGTPTKLTVQLWENSFPSSDPPSGSQRALVPSSQDQGAQTSTVSFPKSRQQS